MSRTHKSARNAFVSLATQLVLLGLGLAVRAVFVAHLGIEFVGLDALFLSIVTMLTLADAGLNIAVIHAMYRPLADGDHAKLTALVALTRRVFRWVAALVFCAGLCVLPFLRDVANLEREVPLLHVYYLILLVSVAGNYLLSYRLTLLIADQRIYLSKIYTVGIQGGRQLAQIVVLLLGLGYLPFIALQAAGTLLTAVFTHWRVGALYPYLRMPSNPLPTEERTGLFRNVKALLMYRASGVVLNNSTPLLVVGLLGAATGGRYANYLLLVGTLVTLLETVFTGLTASVGDLVARSDRSSSRRVFDEITVLSAFLYGTAAVGFAACASDMVALWIGPDFLLGRAEIAAMAFGFLVQGLMSPVLTFRQGTGLFHDARYALVLAAVVNVVLAFLLGHAIGLAGILVATPIARLLTNFWIEPWLLFGRHLEGTLGPYLFRQTLTGALCAASVTFVWSLAPASGNTVADLAIHGVLAILLAAAGVWMQYRRSTAFDALAGRVRRLSRRAT